MNWNKHYQLKDKHSFLSASQWHWINYDPAKLVERYDTFEAAQLGTRIHALAAECIELGIPLKNTKETLGLYVNDAIKFKMHPETILYYSDNAFGTADAISFRHNPKTGRDMLRIHDLKTGKVPAHMEQLMVYAAYFCLEYGYQPRNIDIELRIYQNDHVLVHNAATMFDEDENLTGYDMIEMIIQKVIAFDSLINDRKMEV